MENRELRMKELQNINDIVIYQDGEIELNIAIEKENIWLNQKQLAELFGTKVPAINKHIRNIIDENELTISTISKMEIVQTEGKRQVKRIVEFYNLDMIIAVGYRVNSKKATQFRIWATKILKEYIFNGFAINREKITQQRLLNIEKDVEYLKSKIDKLPEYNQGIFFDGQIYDAYVYMNDLLKSAKKEIVLIDNYVDDTVLTLFSKYPNLKYTIIINNKNLSKQLKLDINKYNSQYNNLTIKTSNKFHDRFLLIDKQEAYHIGASLKDLGKKVFGFSKIEIDLLENIIKGLKI